MNELRNFRVTDGLRRTGNEPIGVQKRHILHFVTAVASIGCCLSRSCCLVNFKDLDGAFFEKKNVEKFDDFIYCKLVHIINMIYASHKQYEM